MNLIETVRADLTLSEKRMRHTEGVVKAALLLAERHFPSLREEDVVLASLLHDYTKECSTDTQIELCLQYRIPIDPTEVDMPKLLHAQTASAIAAQVYHASPEVCSAVRWHTTGRAGMTPLETVLFLADYIEENRTFPTCVKLREYYEKQYAKQEDPALALQKTLVRAFDLTIRELLEDGAPIDRNTVEARNACLKLLQECKQQERKTRSS